MRFYVQLVKNNFQVNLTYRFKFFLQLLHRVTGLLVEISIWAALISQSDGVQTDMGIITLDEMITYAILSTGISIFIGNEVIMALQDKIRTGDIALELIKPMRYKLYLFCQELGNNLFKACFELGPVLLVGWVFFGFDLPSWRFFMIFLIALGLGFVIYFLLAIIIGQLAFWFVTIWHLDRLLNDILKIFSGRFIPLWFFPGFLVTISIYLPFRLIYFAPASIFLGKLTISQSLNVIVQQLLWIVGLLLVDSLIWRNGQRKLVVQGG